VPQPTPPPETQGGRLTTTTADFFVQIDPSQPSATDDTVLHALVARLNGALDGLGSVASARTDATGSYELVASVAEAVNLYEAPASGNYWAASCVSGWLIQATVGRAGGWGGLRTNRSG
jgi:hypothetical protein